MRMNHLRRGKGPRLLLVHGLGGHWRSWSPILDGLTKRREVIAIDLPGFGETPPLAGEVSIPTLADAVEKFLDTNDLLGVDAVGSSMGARLVLELARRGVVGATIALDPGGFWTGWQRPYFYASIAVSIRIVRFLQPIMPWIARSRVGRTLLFAQFSPRPWRWSPTVALSEMRSYAASASFDELLYSLAYGPEQEGAPSGSLRAPVVIGWGRRDRICLPSQSARALELFPDAEIHWFDRCGHFPHWDSPAETLRLILASTSASKSNVRALDDAVASRKGAR